MQAGEKLGPYEILSRIGEGGMGVVYRARDTRLNRSVAIKIAHEKFSDRFAREARAISALNHPNICSIFDVGPNYIVLEYLDGTVARGPLPVKDVLRIGYEIASALDAAHRNRIVHCDLKPANILITKHGVKVLDFGLARRAPQDTQLEEATLTQTLANTGAIAGTLPYMAPEQLEGREADRRSDIFAFGAVLYELITGQRAFSGQNQASLIASILTQEPRPLSQIKPGLPPVLDRLIARCLAKNPEDRWQSARDVALELKFIADSPQQLSAPAQKFRQRIIPWLVGALCGALVGAAALPLYYREQSAPVIHLEMNAPEKSEFSSFGSAISPDGRYVAFVASMEGKQRLWLRPLDSSSARMLEDTDDAQFPFWAPDSTSIGFFARNKVKRFDLNGVGSRAIAIAPNGRGGTWSRDGTIVYSPNLSSRLWRVAATGGEPVPTTVLDPARRESRHNFPQFLPDGRHFLFFLGSADPQNVGPYIGSIDDPAGIQAIPQLKGNPFQAVYAPSGDSSKGHLIYVKDRSLFAQLFDTRSLHLEGEPRPIVSRDSFSIASSPGFLNLTTSLRGTLLDGGGQRTRNELVWRKRDGALLEVVGDEDDYITPRISPDGSRIAVTKTDSISGDYDIWIIDVKQKLSSRLTFHKGLDFYPIWTPDGRSIIYSSDAAGRPSLFRKTAAGSGEAEQLLKNIGANQYGYDVSSDGKFLLFVQIGEADRGDIWVLPLDKSAAPFPYLKTSAGELHPQFSPGRQCGKWIVYTSDESGIEQVYVRRFTGGPAAEAKWQISSNGGKYPRWRGDGSDIVYLAPDGKLVSAAIRFAGESVEAGVPRVLFDAALPSSPFSRYPYDLSPDGQRFLLLNAPRGRSPGTLSITLNWTGLLKR